jgi:hypothetical protein
VLIEDILAEEGDVYKLLYTMVPLFVHHQAHPSMIKTKGSRPNASHTNTKR